MISFTALRRVAFAGGVLGAAIVAGAATIEQRLEALEQRVQALSAENAALRKQLGATTADAPVSVARPAGKEQGFVVGGFLQGQAEFGDAPDPRFPARDRFFFRRARIYVAGGFAEHFDFKAELDLQGNTLGPGTGHSARANEIFVNWNRYEALNLRFGQLKPAFGAEQLLSDTKMLTVERSLANDRIADGRQLAVGAWGKFWNGLATYYAVVGQGNGSNASTNDNDQFQKSVRVTVSPAIGRAGKLTLGANTLWTTDEGVSKPDFGFAGNLFFGDRTMWGVDAQWNLGQFDFTAEYLHSNFEPSSGLTPLREFDADGWHLTGAYYIVPSRLQLFVRADEFDPNTDVGGNFETLTVGANYYLKGDDIRFGVNYISGDAPNADRQARLLTRVQVIF